VTSAVGTLAIGGNLDMSGGGTCSLDINNAAYNSGNDQITVGGSLNVTGTTFHIKPLSGTANLDTTFPYVLIAGSGTPTGLPTTTVVWDGATPNNANAFTVGVVGHNVVLSAASVLGASSATASPASINRYGSTSFSVSLVNGTAPYIVTVDYSLLKGDAPATDVQTLTGSGLGPYTGSAVTPVNTLAPGTYLLPLTVTDTTTPTHQTYNGNISVTFTGATLVWNGDASGNSYWDTAGELEWQGGLTYDQGDLVTFDDSAAANPNVTNVNLVTTLSPGSITVNNTAALPTAQYTFSGSGKISGATSLSKSGSGTLTLAGSGGDNFSGGISVSASGGTVVLDNTSSSISGGATIGSGATLQLGNNDTKGALPSGTFTSSGTLAFDRSDNPLLWNPVIASGSVAQVGSGVLQLYGANTYSGTTLIQNGTVMVTNNASLGTLPGGAVTINSGGTLDIGGFAPTLTGLANQSANFGTKQFNIAGAGVGGKGAIINSGWTNEIHAFEQITLTADATIGGNSAAANPQTGRYDVRGGIATLDLAGHKLTKTGSNLVAVVAGVIGNTGGGGSIEISSGVFSIQVGTQCTNNPAGSITVDNGGTLGTYGATAGTLTWPITLNAGAAIENDGSSSPGIDSSITLAGNATLVGSGFTTILNGVISSSGSYGLILATNLWTTIGGQFTLGATNTYTGNTIINNGTLALAATGSISNSAAISIAAGTTFDVSAITTFNLSSSTALSASGTGVNPLGGAVSPTNAAAIKGASGGTVNLGSQPITLGYDGTHPALYISQGTLSLNGNAFTVNTASPLTSGSYVIVQQASGNITSAGSYAVSGTAIGSSRTASISVVNGTVVLAIVEHQPVALNATYSRAQNTALKISITNLIAQYTSDPANDQVGLVSVAGGLLTNGMVIATTANGSSIYYTNNYNGSAYIVLTPVNNLGESFQYVVQNNSYPALTATNLITITMTNAVGQATGLITYVGPNSATTSWAGVVGDNYVVQSRTNLIDDPWHDRWTTNSVPGVFTFTDTFTNWGGIPPAQSYYRLRSN
jgi:autotransporter-associated beta strand protein